MPAKFCGLIFNPPGGHPCTAPNKGMLSMNRHRHISRLERRNHAVLGKESGLTHASMPAHLPSHGGTVLSLAHNLGVPVSSIDDFSTNTFFSATELTAELVKDTPYVFEHYPDSQCTALREALAAHEQVSPEQVIIGNGSAELIFLLMHALKPGSACLATPLFSEYARACETFNIPVHEVRLSPGQDFAFGREELLGLWKNSAELTVFCIPNNPTGQTYANLPAVLESASSSRILIDATYREFLWDDPAYAQTSWQAYNHMARPGAALTLLAGFTKFFACPGIRLGYAVADKAIINRLNTRRAPWTVSAFAQHMGLRFLERIADYRALLPELHFQRNQMAEALLDTGLFREGSLRQGPSFITLAVQEPLTALDLAGYLLDKRILIRVCDNIPGMPPNYVRMQARPLAACDNLLLGLEQFARGR